MTSGATVPPLRDYQADLIAQAREALRGARRVCLQLPTGGGKTVIGASIARASAAKAKRSLFLVHRDRLATQTVRTFDGFGIAPGVIAAGRSMADRLVQVGMVQTVARRLERLRPPDLIFIDEAHHAPAGSWAKILEAFPSAAVIGLTATPERLDGRGLDDSFDRLVCGPDVRTLIDRGYLADYAYLAPPQRIDLSGVRSRAGDFAVNELGLAMDKATITGDAVEHYARHLAGRPAIAFCVTLAHAAHVAEAFRSRGFRAASIDGSLPEADRERLMGDLAAGRLNVLTSCELISEGVDVPAVGGVILLRPTRSLAMFLQQVGRGLRPKPDGSSAVILDHVGNCHRHGMPDTARCWSLNGRPKRAQSPGVRQCSRCFKVFPPGGVICAEPDSECPLSGEAHGGGGRAAPDTVDGQLERLTQDVLAARRPDWAEGIDLLTARGAVFKRLVRLADTRAKLQQIADVRGYKPGWVHMVMVDREAGRPGRLPSALDETVAALNREVA